MSERRAHRAYTDYFSSHVNIAVDGMEKNDGWASISGKAA